MIITLTQEQSDAVNKAYSTQEKCSLCQAILNFFVGKAILAQPYSHTSNKAGTMQVNILCTDCHGHIAKAITDRAIKA